MKREDFDVAVGVVERIDKLEKTIFALQGIMNKKSYTIIASEDIYHNEDSIEDKIPVNVVELKEDELSTVIFTQDILEYYINVLNLELNELKKEFEDI